MRFFLPLLFVLALSTSAGAQQPKKVHRIGFLSLTSRSVTVPLHTAFQQGLQELGYVGGQNIELEYRWADGKVERLPELAAELIHLKVDVIVMGPLQPALAAKKATRQFPSSSRALPILLPSGSLPTLLDQAAT